MTDLNNLIPADSGWELEQAKAINDAGQIVGFGTHNGQTRAFLLLPVDTTGHTISGQITYEDTGLEEVTVAYAGPRSGSVMTDANGDYAIPALPDGTYTLTPSKTDYGFSPSDQSIPVSGGNVLAVDFEAYRTSEKSSVKGTAFDERNGNGLAGVQISLGDRQTITDSQRRYQIEEITPGDYTQ